MKTYWLAEEKYCMFILYRLKWATLWMLVCKQHLISQRCVQSIAWKMSTIISDGNGKYTHWFLLCFNTELFTWRYYMFYVQWWSSYWALFCVYLSHRLYFTESMFCCKHEHAHLSSYQCQHECKLCETFAWMSFTVQWNVCLWKLYGPCKCIN